MTQQFRKGPIAMTKVGDMSPVQTKGAHRRGGHLELGDGLDTGRGSRQQAQKPGAQDGHPVQGLGDEVGRVPAGPDAGDGGPLPLELVSQVLGVQLLEGVEVVEHHDQRHVELRARQQPSQQWSNAALVKAWVSGHIQCHLARATKLARHVMACGCFAGVYATW